MKMVYQLNGKTISHSKYLMTFQGIIKWIDSQVVEAIDKGEKAKIFDTNAGPLVITVTK